MSVHKDGKTKKWYVNCRYFDWKGEKRQKCKRGFLTKPVNKRYSIRQLCRILNINMLKSALPMEQICGLLSYINGELDNEADDLIDDSVLYFLFVRLASDYARMHNAQGRDRYLEELLSDYQEPIPGAKERVAQVLRIMLTAWAAAQLRQQAEGMVKSLQSTVNVYKEA